MIFSSRFINAVSIAALVVAHAEQQPSIKRTADAPNPTIAPEGQGLQGTWVGPDAANPRQTVTITITDNSLHFYRDEDFWFDTAISLPADTNPKQIHAIIKACPPSQTSSVGEEVGAIFKIEGGTLTLTSFDISSDPPETFSNTSSLYVLKKTKSKTKDAGPPESRSKSGLASLLA